MRIPSNAAPGVVTVGFLWIGLVNLALHGQDQPLGQGVNFYSAASEAALGARLADQLRSETTPLASTAVQKWVDDVGARLAAQLPAGNLKYTFTLIQDDRSSATHEPIALPGGYVFVSAQLILTAHNEAEFAGILAHAMAHVAARHGTRSATRAELANMAHPPTVYMGREAGNLVPLGLLAIQRKFELEADVIAARVMAKSGYDPTALGAYIERVQKPESSPYRTLPNPDQRVENLKREVSELPPRAYTLPDGLPPIQDVVRQVIPVPPPPSLR